jgi:hypothetical protein
MAIAERKCLHDIEPDQPLYDFDGYEALASIEGGMGLVIIARDPELDRKVAIKLWKSTGAAAEAALLAEAKTLAKLSHPNVVTVHRVGKFEDSVYLVMEYVDGMDGRAWLRTPRTWQEIRDVFVDAGLGLAAAHEAGIQHGDFKPPNMLVGSDGRTRVADFGVADTLRTFAEDEPPSDGVPGTPDYMAPERLRGERGDARSDQFSFCVSMWRALHGLRLHGGESMFQLLDALESGTSIRAGDERVPGWLTRVVKKGLAEDPDERYGDMHELVRALRGDGVAGETKGDEGDDEDAVEDEARVLHAPSLGATGDERVRLALVTSGIVAGLAVLAVTFIAALVVLRSPAPVPEPTRDEPTRGEPLRESTRAQLGVTPEQVIELVESGELDRAEEMWTDEVRHRETAEVVVYADSIRVGEAFLQQARRLKDEGRLMEARTAAEAAQNLGFVAVRDLERYDQPADAGNELAKRASQFLRDLRELL